MTTNDNHNNDMSSTDPFDLLLGEDRAASPDPTDHPWELYMLRTLALARIAAEEGDWRSRMTDGLRAWYAQHAADLGIHLPDLMTARNKDADDDPPTAPIRIPLQAILDHRTPPPPPSPLQLRLDWVSVTLELDEIDALVLGIAVRLSISPVVRALVGLTQRTFLDDESHKKFVSRLLALNAHEAHDRLGDEAPLRRLGLLDGDHGDLMPSALLVDLLEADTVDPAELERKLLVQKRQPHLLRTDFDHLGAAVDDLVRILNGALARRATGVNVLLYGPPGTGKTELASLLGTLCTAHVIFAGETGEGNSEPTRQDRLTHLSLLSALGQRLGRTIAVVDEAEEIFAGVDTEFGFGSRQGSKVFLNRALERSPIPTVWITNHPHLLGAAVLRRMVRVIELRTPGPAVRRRIVDRHAQELGVWLDLISREQLAQLPVAPAIIVSALRAAHLGGETAADGIGAMAVASAISIHEVMTGRVVALPSPEAAYFDPALSFADIDLEELEARTVAAGSMAALSFLFTGPPGTGKSAFARHLASRLGMEVLHARASDLLGMYVGQTEASIARTFKEATANRQFLIIDEADSLLSDRRGAVRTWEVSQVNELLTWMEAHSLPFAMTSNVAERLDPATLRRFLFKVAFFPLTSQQIGVAFQRFFGVEAPAGILKLDPVTAGDFAIVARKAKVLQVTDSVALGSMLRAEVELKRSTCSPVGFT